MTNAPLWLDSVAMRWYNPRMDKIQEQLIRSGLTGTSLSRILGRPYMTARLNDWKKEGEVDFGSMPVTIFFQLCGALNVDPVEYLGQDVIDGTVGNIESLDNLANRIKNWNGIPADQDDFELFQAVSKLNRINIKNGSRLLYLRGEDDHSREVAGKVETGQVDFAKETAKLDPAFRERLLGSVEEGDKSTAAYLQCFEDGGDRTLIIALFRTSEGLVTKVEAIKAVWNVGTNKLETYINTIYRDFDKFRETVEEVPVSYYEFMSAAFTLLRRFGLKT